MEETDWKSALAALGTKGETEATDSKNVERKKRLGVVYSSNPDFNYTAAEAAEQPTLPPQQQRLRLSMERAGRGGKTVTLVKGFVGTEADCNALCKLLKQKCGVGGTVKEGAIIIQGDHRQRLTDILKKEGYSQTRG